MVHKESKNGLEINIKGITNLSSFERFKDSTPLTCSSLDFASISTLDVGVIMSEDNIGNIIMLSNSLV